MTDERHGDALWTALARLPRGSGVVLRHHDTPDAARVPIRARIVRCARRRGLVMAEERVLPQSTVVCLGAAGARRWIARARTPREAIVARRRGASGVLVSPMFATRTHPDRPALGRWRAAAIARAARLPAIALGGMTARRFYAARILGFHGWAAIDGLTLATRVRDAQKRKAVPI